MIVRQHEQPRVGRLVDQSGLSKQLVTFFASFPRFACSRSLSVLVATTTLAMGVNLPARLVIIKGTNHYRGAKGYQELPK